MNRLRLFKTTRTSISIFFLQILKVWLIQLKETEINCGWLLKGWNSHLTIIDIDLVRSAPILFNGKNTSQIYFKKCFLNTLFNTLVKKCGTVFTFTLEIWNSVIPRKASIWMERFKANWRWLSLSNKRYSPKHQNHVTWRILKLRSETKPKRELIDDFSFGYLVLQLFEC